MKWVKLIIGLLFCVTVIVCSCHKDHSIEGLTFKKVDTLPVNYPFAKGFCSATSLGIPIADTNDFSDLLPAQLPDSIMLDMPIAGNQGQQGSCTAWATVYAAGTYSFHKKMGKSYSDTGNLSPKYTYNQITKGVCVCTSFLDHLYLLKTQGACVLNSMPYDPTECAKQPDSLQKLNASTYKITGWAKVDLHNLTLIKRALNKKMPVLFGIYVDDGFSHLSAPFIWNKYTGTSGDGHALVITGYNDSLKAFRFMNSWSTAWGDNGSAWIDYSFFLKNVMETGYVIIP